MVIMSLQMICNGPSHGKVFKQAQVEYTQTYQIHDWTYRLSFAFSYI